MKKMFVLLAAVVITASVWASPSPAENVKVKAAFEKEFTGATNVQWSGSDEVYIASFIFNNERMRAWFTSEGEIDAIQRNVKRVQMTYLSSKAVDKLEKEQTILSIAEINKESDMYYLVKSENDKFENLYKLTPAGNLTRIEKKRKK
jgi:hypothetical protein